MRRLSIAAAAILVLAVAVHCTAQQEKGYWRAASNTAARITGDIVISDAKLTVNFTSFTLAPIRSLKPAEVGSVFDTDVNTAGPGMLYRLNVPASKRFLHHNTLCGTDDTHWMATYASGRTLQAAFFTGDDEPVFTMDAISNSRRVCGTYSFVR